MKDRSLLIERAAKGVSGACAKRILGLSRSQSYQALKELTEKGALIKVARHKDSRWFSAKEEAERFIQTIQVKETA